MAALDMSLDNMVQNNRHNGARGGGRVRGMRGVSCPGGQGRGLRGVSCPGGQGRGLRGVSCPGGQGRGLRGVRGPGGQGRGLRGVSCPGGQGRGMRGVRGPGGQGRGLRGLSCPGLQGRGLRGVSCPGLQGRGLRGVSCPGLQGRGLQGVRCPGGQGRGLQGVRGPGGPIRGVVRSVFRQHRGPLGIHSIVKAMRRTRNFPWQNSVLGDRIKAAGTSGGESGSKLQVSNLNAGVSNEDIRKMFSEIGELVRYGIQYDKNGMPCGSAEVVFARRGDAFQAVKKYNNTQLDGNPMKIENVRTIARGHVASRLNIVGEANGRRTVDMTPRTGYMRNRPGPGYMRNRPGTGYTRNRPGAGYMSKAAVLNHDVGPSCQRARGGWNTGVPVRGRGGCGRGRRHSGLGGMMVEKSVEELDKEPEIYQAETTQTI